MLSVTLNQSFHANRGLPEKCTCDEYYQAAWEPVPDGQKGYLRDLVGVHERQRGLVST